MPVEVGPNFIRIRVANPKQFIRFRVKTLGSGIKAVIGFKKGGGSQIQSLLFPKSRYTVATARAWVKKHNYSVQETYLVSDIIFGKDLEYGNFYFIEETVKDDYKEDDIPKDLKWFIEGDF